MAKCARTASAGKQFNMHGTTKETARSPRVSRFKIKHMFFLPPFIISCILQLPTDHDHGLAPAPLRTRDVVNFMTMAFSAAVVSVGS